jgi:GAF domain-containing protein
VRAFVTLADTLVSDFDVSDLLDSLVTHSVNLLDADAAGLLLSDQKGGLAVVASSSEQTHGLEVFQIQVNEGPCLECCATGEPVSAEDIGVVAERWPAFAAAAAEAGHRSVLALPLRVRGEVIGAMNLFRNQTGPFPQIDVELAQGLSDVAAIGILQQRAIQNRELLVEQLQGALNSRIVIEQAKGMLAERGQIELSDAFAALRGYARSSSTGLAQVAADVLSGSLSPDLVLVSRAGARKDQGTR